MEAILPSVEQETRQRLLARLGYLQSQERYWRAQIAQLDEPPREQTTSNIIQLLLNSNDHSIHNLAQPEASKHGPETPKNVSPLPSDSKFHALTIQRTHLRQKTRDIQYTILNVSHKTTFQLTVAISSSPITHHVHGLDARDVTPIDANRELTPLIQTCKSSGDILALMHGLSKYASHLARRTSVFKSLSEVIDPLDDLWLDPETTFCTPSISFDINSKCILTLTWQAFFDSVTAEFYTSPSIGLSLVDGTPLPANLQNYRQVFDILLRQRGVYTATVVFADILAS
ncbi:hypothetical protein TRVA0_054S00628 [Trichomonascus vanleenenianus]|uniref:uncharacterized protein n=1 Tax=Trichomonascus vanleenenianus TaxID=2268995 RepID=UPI003ECAA0F8